MTILRTGSSGNLVTKMTILRTWIDDREIVVRFPVGSPDGFLSQPSNVFNGYRGSLCGGKEA